MTRRRRWGACPSNKIRFRNRKAALAGIDTHRNRWARRTPPGTPLPDLYVYRCPHCHGWHLTSIPQPDEADAS